MAALFHLEVITPEKLFFTGQVSSLIMETPEGEIGILAGHVPAVIALTPAPMKFMLDGKWKTAAISGGFAQVKEGAVIVLSDTAEWPEEIEEKRARLAKERAESRLSEQLSELEYIQTRVALKRALTRLKILQRGKE